MSSAADIAICFESALQPIGFENEQVETTTMGHDVMRPYAAADAIRSRRFGWPGTSSKPVPMLLYSSGVYFARLVDMVIKGSDLPLAHKRVLVSDMADVLRDMAANGLGVTWLPDRTAALNPGLEALPGDEWLIPLTIKAFRLRDNTNRASWRLWENLKSTNDEMHR
jgi:LysR family transcriptional regulator, hypochlorite-specific transcription factor HypT